jgi:hypothetical protein
MQDWLGNELEVGGLVTYSSSSTNTGMNLGELLHADETKIQIRVWQVTRKSYSRAGETYSPGKIVTLLNGNGAYRSVTRYFGKVPNRSDNG